MTDVEDIIHYIKSLRKGFDKDLFQRKIDELAYIVENEGLEYNDFQTLFKVWLNLSIPITKWTSLGACLVPNEKIGKLTIDYALRWLLAKHDNQSNFSNISFLLDWLTAAMDCNSVELDALNIGYEVFYSTLTYEALAPHSIKLVYNLTKPSDVTRRRVVELLNCAKKREAKKNLYRQIQVLLGLFKSYRPECVPEDIPSISIHTSFRKINANLLNRFTISQSKRNLLCNTKQYLLWTNPINCDSGRNKKDPLIPNMEFLKLGSMQYIEQVTQKTYLDFSSPVSLLKHSVSRSSIRPARLRALLCNDTGTTLLALASDNEQAFFSHDLHHILNHYNALVLASCLSAASRCARADVCLGAACSVPAALLLALPLLAPSAATLDHLVHLILTYRKIFSKLKNKNNGVRNTHEFEHRQLLKAYTSDIISCLYQENFLSNRQEGYVFSKLNMQTVTMLNKVIPNADSKLSLRNHLAFAPYTYLQIEGSQAETIDNSMWFKYAIDKQFPSLCKLLIMTTPQLIS
ncbi:uncharacterized protein LOC123723035 [Papilio machaon]|uniref:uncharacterized protein LOC123723035 n=1 Tax=Papilio machaon TaxID=76193 RepID=UPI001E664D0E|nr:uncharacterized protein LOC123723035 [Papilio machaon]